MGVLHENLYTFVISRSLPGHHKCFRKMLQGKIKTQTFQKSWRLSDNVEKYNTVDQATDDNLLMCFAC